MSVLVKVFLLRYTSAIGFNNWIPNPASRNGILADVPSCLFIEVIASSRDFLDKASSPIAKSNNLSGKALNIMPTSKGIGIFAA